MSETTKRFVIDRSKWRFGGVLGESLGLTALLNQDNYQCCLGFASEQLGVPRSALEAVIVPIEIEYDDRSCLIGSLLEEIKQSDGIDDEGDPDLIVVQREMTRKAITVNDGVSFASQEEREQQLVQIFAEGGFELVFEGEYTEKQKAIIAKCADGDWRDI